MDTRRIGGRLFSQPTRSGTRILLLAVSCLLGLSPAAAESASRREPRPDAAAPRLASADRQASPAWDRRLPLRFEANRGQTDSRVAFLSRGRGYTLFLTPAEAVLVLLTRGEPDGGRTAPRHAVVRIRLVGAHPTPKLTGLQELPGRSHYFLGDDPKAWRTGVPGFAKVEYEQVYPGIDLVYYGNAGLLEHDFILAPGADPGAIQIAFEGIDGMEIEADGSLLLRTPAGPLRLQRPRAFQETETGSRAIRRSRYAISSSHRAGIEVAAYDGSRTLVIDPILTYSSYLGGNAEDNGGGIAFDGTGIYLGGLTGSTSFPTQDPLQGWNAGGFDAFVAKLDPTGSSLIFATYFGGSGDEIQRDMAVDAAGSAYLVGETTSTDLPTTAGALDATCGGDGFCDGGNPDVFVAKLDPAGSALSYSTYLGGGGSDIAGKVAVDAGGSAHLVGYTRSTDFPTSAGALDRECGSDGLCDGGSWDAFAAKLDPAGSSLSWSTYLGGSGVDRGFGIALDAEGHAYLSGSTFSADFPASAGAFDTTCGSDGACDGADDAFVAKLAADGSSLLYAAFLGGSGDGDSEIDEFAWAIDVDHRGSAYLTGQTDSADFPLSSPLFPGFAGGGLDSFAVKVDPLGSSLEYATYLGGSRSEQGFGIAVDWFGNAYLTGTTDSLDFPLQDPLPGPGNACQNCEYGFLESYLVRLDASGSVLLYSTYLGGSSAEYGSGLAVGDRGEVYLAGDTYSTDFPIVDPLQSTHGAGSNWDAFLAVIETADTDGDGVEDDADNCTRTRNPDQRDSNGDGYGNACDPDLDGDGTVNFVDLGILKSVFFGADEDADLNGDGVVNFLDLGIMKSFFFEAPGPKCDACPLQ